MLHCAPKNHFASIETAAVPSVRWLPLHPPGPLYHTFVLCCFLRAVDFRYPENKSDHRS